MPRYSRFRPLCPESGTTHTRPIHVLESTHSSSLTNSLPYIYNHMQACHFPLGWEPMTHFRNCQQTVQQTFPLISPDSTFQVESLATSDYASWRLWTKHEPTWLPMVFWIKRLPSVAPQKSPLECQLLASYWALLEIKVLTDLHPVLLCTQLLIMPWIRGASQKISLQKSVAFLYNNNEKSEKGLKNTILFTVASKIILWN